jgi:hypothetical protein
MSTCYHDELARERLHSGSAPSVDPTRDRNPNRLAGTRDKRLVKCVLLFQAASPARTHPPLAVLPPARLVMRVEFRRRKLRDHRRSSPTRRGGCVVVDASTVPCGAAGEGGGGAHRLRRALRS